MNSIGKLTLVLAMAIVLLSCKKKSQLSAREEQIQNEITQPLLPNEIIEQEGIRFLLNYEHSNAQLQLRLYKGTSLEFSPVDIEETQPYVNYSVRADQMLENTDYTLVVEFKSITKNGSFDLSLIGFTEINGTKTFGLNAVPFTTGQSQMSKAFIKIHKGVQKFSFYVL
ncbi:hypothetical protein [Flavitalea sp.]|nr:hypothetical protein [Flavitalea sp.]